MERHDLLEVTTSIAAELLCSGAEIYRVEESALRILEAYGEQQGEVFAIPSLLVVSIRLENGQSMTQVRRLREQGVHLERIRACSDLCRQICKDLPSKSQIETAIRQIDRVPVYPAGVTALAYACVAGGFTLLFGGSAADCAAALFAGVTVQLTLKWLQKLDTNSFFTTILASFASTGVVCLCVWAGLGTMPDKIIIGALMTLVPGLALTNAMRDIMASDLIAGITRLITVLLTAGGIALGTGAALSLFRFLGVAV